VDPGIFQNGPSQGFWGCRSPSGVQGQSPGRGSGGQSPPETKADVKYLYIVNVFLEKMWDKMNRSRDVVQTHNYKKLNFQCVGLTPNQSPLGTPLVQATSFVHAPCSPLQQQAAELLSLLVSSAMFVYIQTLTSVLRFPMSILT